MNSEYIKLTKGDDHYPPHHYPLKPHTLVAGGAVELGGPVAVLAGVVAVEALRGRSGGISVHVERTRAVAVAEPEEGSSTALDAGALVLAEADVAVIGAGLAARFAGIVVLAFGTGGVIVTRLLVQEGRGWAAEAVLGSVGGTRETGGVAGQTQSLDLVREVVCGGTLAGTGPVNEQSARFGAA